MEEREFDICTYEGPLVAEWIHVWTAGHCCICIPRRACVERFVDLLYALVRPHPCTAVCCVHLTLITPMTTGFLNPWPTTKGLRVTGWMVPGWCNYAKGRTSSATNPIESQPN